YHRWEPVDANNVLTNSARNQTLVAYVHPTLIPSPSRGGGACLAVPAPSSPSPLWGGIKGGGSQEREVRSSDLQLHPHHLIRIRRQFHRELPALDPCTFALLRLHFILVLGRVDGLQVRMR